MRVQPAVVAFAMVPVLAAAQQLLPNVRPPVDPNIRFEVVSIKPFDASGGAPVGVLAGLDRFDSSGVPLGFLLPQAVGMPANRVIYPAGRPNWLDIERYTIAAKAPAGAPPAAMSVMIRNLLKDRFNLVTHRDTREMPVFNLVFARNDKRFGPALKESSLACQATIAASRGDGGQAAAVEAIRRGGAAPAAVSGSSACNGGRVGPGLADYSGVYMAQVVSILTQIVGRPVINRTGLTSVYDYTLKWAQEPGSPVPGPLGLPAPVSPGELPAPDPSAPNIFTAVQEQLGLRLESAREPVDVVVIDRIEKPTLD